MKASWTLPLAICLSFLYTNSLDARAQTVKDNVAYMLDELHLKDAVTFTWTGSASVGALPHLKNGIDQLALAWTTDHKIWELVPAIFTEDAHRGALEGWRTRTSPSLHILKFADARTSTGYRYEAHVDMWYPGGFFATTAHLLCEYIPEKWFHKNPDEAAIKRRLLRKSNRAGATSG